MNSSLSPRSSSSVVSSSGAVRSSRRNAQPQQQRRYIPQRTAVIHTSPPHLTPTSPPTKRPSSLYSGGTQQQMSGTPKAQSSTSQLSQNTQSTPHRTLAPQQTLQRDTPPPQQTPQRAPPPQQTPQQAPPPETRVAEERRKSARTSSSSSGRIKLSSQQLRKAMLGEPVYLTVAAKECNVIAGTVPTSNAGHRPQHSDIKTTPTPKIQKSSKTPKPVAATNISQVPKLDAGPSVPVPVLCSQVRFSKAGLRPGVSAGGYHIYRTEGMFDLSNIQTGAECAEHRSSMLSLCDEFYRQPEATSEQRQPDRRPPAAAATPLVEGELSSMFICWFQTRVSMRSPILL